MVYKNLSKDEFIQLGHEIKILKQQNAKVFPLMQRACGPRHADTLLKHQAEIDNLILVLERKLEKEFPDIDTLSLLY